MAKLPVDISLFVEDVRVVLRTPSGSFSISAYPADVHTKDWVTKRQKETNRANMIAPLELQWCSLGILEFMEGANGEIWSASERKKQITFYLSILTPDHVRALQAQIERKHGISITREQIQPVVLTGFQATIEIVSNDLRRVFYGAMKNLDALRPLSCMFQFETASDMQLVLDEINSDEGVALTCQIAVGGVKYEVSALNIPNKRIADANMAVSAFGANEDFAMFTPSQLNSLAQQIVNVITIPEVGAAGGNITDMKPLVLTALQASPMEVQLTPELIQTVSPLNGEDMELKLHMDRHIGSMQDYIRGENVEMDPHIPPRSPPSGAKHRPKPAGSGHKKSHKEGFDSLDLEEKGYKEAGSALNSPSRMIGGIADKRDKHGGGKRLLYRVQRSKLQENICLQWPKLTGTAQSCVYSPITIESATHICQFTERSFREEPRKVTNVSVLRLPQSAWVHFRGPSDSGGSPVVSFTVHAQPLVEEESDAMMNAGAKDVQRKPRRHHRSTVTASGTNSPINVGPLKENMDYRFVIECCNATGGTSATEPMLHTTRENEMFSIVPLYGIILYAGPLDSIPANFRRLDGSEAGAPNLSKVFNITASTMTQALAPPAGQTATAPATVVSDPKWSSLCYIQRIA